MLTDSSFYRSRETLDILNKTLANNPERKINLDKWIILEDDGKQYQSAYPKALIKVYKDYNLDNEPLPGYKIFERLQDCNVFKQDNDQWFYWSYYESVEDMRKNLMKSAEEKIKDAEEQIKQVEEKKRKQR